ncbi:methyltransferase domain-containing protein [Thioalkalivibrio sp.]|uniref:methyltransferase domain-containing protein n=1 Tax=Thioalkalivibrio sp. TaxID=2093813 RepID=UPI00356AA4B1
MDLKHSPERGFHQASRADCLRDWYRGPHGLRTLAGLRQHVQVLCRPRFGDAWLEVGPVSLLHPEWTGPVHALHADPRSRTLPAQGDLLPLAAATFSCVLVAHAVGDAGDAGDVIAEAARVLAPEGHLFLLECSHCGSPGRHRLRPGLRRRSRRLLRRAGLEVHRQVALSLLPAVLPDGWHRRLGPLDAAVSPWLPVLGSCVLTVGRRRDLMPIAPAPSRLRWSRDAVRAGGRSQWA